MARKSLFISTGPVKRGVVTVEDRYALVEDLAAKHGEQLRRFLRTRVRNAADIPDIIQEAYLRLLRVPNHETIRAPEAYIFTIAHHVAQQHSLRSAARAAVTDLSQVLDEVRAVTDVDPALEVSAQQCIEELDDALSELSPKVQYTFLAYKRDGLSMDEISARLGISRPMAKKYLVKALVHLRKRLKTE
jgi:RNA polymerase sigma-70 factor (ECF subfamily)